MDRDETRLCAFLLDLYRSARAEQPHEFQKHALERLRELVEFDFGAWGGGAAEDRQVTDVVMLDQSERLFGEWMEVAAEDAYCDLALRRLDHTVLFDDVPEFRRSFAWNEHWRRFDAENMIATIMAEPIDGYVSFVGLCNADRSRNFGRRDRELKQLLMPHLSSALHLSRENMLRHASSRDEGLAIVNSGGWVLASQPPFAALARAEWGRAGPRLPASFVEAGLDRKSWRGRAIALRIQQLPPYYLLRATPVSPLEALTPREREVAEQFARGLSYKEVAVALHIAPATVRNHLARIYDKLGLETKSELVRLLATG
jgi:DNA-binding CsgD family transcriptional regulator